MLYLALFLIGFNLILANEFPPEVKFCKKSDPNFTSCVAKNMIDSLAVLSNGYKKLSIPKLQPFHLDQMEILGSDTGAVRLNQKYTQIELRGMATGVCKNLKIDFETGIWEFDVVTPHLTMEANYEMKGQLLVFPLNGFGKSLVTMENMTVHYTLQFERYKKNEKTYLNLKDIKMDMNPEKVTFHFDNIIPDNKEMSENVLKTMNENSDSIFKDIKAGFEAAFGKIYLQVSNGVFSKVPENELFLD